MFIVKQLGWIEYWAGISKIISSGMVAQRAEPKAKKRGICRTTGWQPTIFWGDKCTVRFACIITYVKHLTCVFKDSYLLSKCFYTIFYFRVYLLRWLYLTSLHSNIWQWAWSLKVFFVHAHNSEPNTPCTMSFLKSRCHGHWYAPLRHNGHTHCCQMVNDAPVKYLYC